MTRSAPIVLATILAVTVLAGCVAGSAGSTGTAGVSSPTVASPASPTSPSATASPTATVTLSPVEAIEAVPPAEGTLNAILVGPEVVLAGGALGAATQPTILRFEGGTWINTDVPSEWQGVPGQVMGLAEVGGTFFAVGNELPEKRRGFVWFSVDDGATWENSLSQEDAAFYDIAASGETVIAVGAHLDAEMNPMAIAYSSPNRESWAGGGDVESASGQAMGSVTATTDGFAAVGTGATTAAPGLTVWRTTDGATWSAVAAELPPLQLPTGMVEATDRRLAISGASGKSGDPQQAFVAFSADGRSWEREILSEGENEGYASALTLVAGDLVVAGVDADRLTIWTEAEGAWQPEVIEPGGAAINDLAWDPLVGLVGVGSKDGHYAVWLLRGPP